jgi:general secretion pathway protein G
MKKAFTMVELVFVIVVIGILSAIAIPKFAATRDDAVISKAIAEVAAMRSAIATERQKRILRGDFSPVVAGDVRGLLEYNLSSNWAGTGLSFSGGGKSCTFTVAGNKLVTSSGCTLPGI